MATAVSVGDRVIVGSTSKSKDDLVLLAVQGGGTITPDNARHVMAFESLAERDAFFTAPLSGDIAYVDDVQSLYIYSDETVPGWAVVAAWPNRDFIPLDDLSDVVLTAPATAQ